MQLVILVKPFRVYRVRKRCSGSGYAERRDRHPRGDSKNNRSAQQQDRWSNNASCQTTNPFVQLLFLYFVAAGLFRISRSHSYSIWLSGENAAAAADEPGRTHPRRRRDRGMKTISVTELHVGEYRVRVALHHVRDTSGLGKRLAVERAARRVPEWLQHRDRNRLLAVIKREVLAIDREAQILIVLVAYTENPAVKVQRDSWRTACWASATGTYRTR